MDQDQSNSQSEIRNPKFENTIVFDNVSKFYGEILGVNRVNLTIPLGITSLVGPNGAGKTTLMNLMTGLLRPSRGAVSVLGVPTDRPEQLFRKVGYCSQFDSFPRGMTGQPSVLILDEPLNGLDPMVRAETIALFRQLAADGLHLIISSHILHEVDMMSDRVVLLNNGYVVAEGAVHGVRDEMDVEHPMQILIRCDQPSLLAARLFQKDEVVEARVHDDRHGLFVKTRNPDRFYLMLNEVVATGEVEVETVAPVDDDLSAVYEYLIGSE